MLDALNITEEEALGLAELAQHDLALGLGFPPDAIARWRDLPDSPQAAMDLEPDEDEPLWSRSA